MSVVLIIEDNIDNYELVRFLLERAGYETRWARGGAEGRRAVRGGLGLDARRGGSTAGKGRGRHRARTLGDRERRLAEARA